MSKSMVPPDRALPGRDAPWFAIPDQHAVLGTSLIGPWAEGTVRIYLAMGCFWGAEEIYWRLPGVVSTSVGYMGGYSGHPSYEEVCSGMTGHTETVSVTYDPTIISDYDILKVFWESHDPTQGNRQGNDIGTQYRSAIFYTTPGQRAMAELTRDAYNAVISDRGYPEITTTIRDAADFTYYFAEDYHQQYLYKRPNGYRCHANTGLALPALTS
ncbi:MAG: peptide-methionine (S)-S-oxide reductase MsrA [Candidatus Nanopelagicales bacterium]